MLSELYDQVRRRLTDDAVLLSLLGVDASNQAAILERIDMRMNPGNLQEEKLPLIAFHAAPRLRFLEEENRNCSIIMFHFHVFTKGEVELALRIADRLTELFQDDVPFVQKRDMEGLSTVLIDQYEKEIDLNGLFCLTSIFKFTIQID
ncbi:hypothetical protein [Paenibacillus sp. NPDC058071]|uniref:hypothetical protein n=1 Tax=Paenibacillus sp. NPDC058071 TaxID=3346326 RepID=UPI0036DF034B